MSEQGFTLPSETVRARGRKPGPRDEGGPGNVPGVRYDQYNRAMLPTPSDPGGPDVPWTRVTTITGAANQNEGLRIWTERKLIDGLASWPAGRAMLGTHADEPKVLDEIREQAKDRAGIHDAANYGTAFHRDFQRWAELGGWWKDSLTWPVGFQPQPEVERDITAATCKVEQVGLVIQRCEVLVANEHLRVAGRLDHLWAPIMNDHPLGGDAVRVGDGKTGEDAGTNPVKLWTTALQLSAYANMTHVYDVATKTFTRLDEAFNIDRATGYLLAVRDGVAELLELPIAESWREFLAAWELHQGKKRSLAVRPVGRPVMIPEPGPEIDPWEAAAEVDIWTAPVPVPDGVIACGPDGIATELDPGDAATVQAFADELTAEPVDQGSGPPPGWIQRADGSWRDPATVTAELDTSEPVPGPGARQDLAPLAGPGERGCSVCGRKGHRATIKGAPNPVCLGDADPAKTGATEQVTTTGLGADGIPFRMVTERPADPYEGVDPAPLPGEPTPFTQAMGIPDANFCDAHCDGSAVGWELRIRRDDRGKATGAYECSGCEKRATVAAVRQHMSNRDLFSPTGRPVDPGEQDAAAARLAGTDPIPDPPAQLSRQDTHKHSWSRRPESDTWWCPDCGKQATLTDLDDLPEDWRFQIETATSTEGLAQVVERMQSAGAATSLLMELAKQRWQFLSDQEA